MQGYNAKTYINKISKIIDNNTIENGIKIISQLPDPYTNVKIGKNKAAKIYLLNVRKIVKYNEKKYGNNISKYNKLISEKIDEINACLQYELLNELKISITFNNFLKIIIKIEIFFFKKQKS